MTTMNKIQNILMSLARVAMIARGAEDEESSQAIAEAMLVLAALSDIASRCAQKLGQDEWREIVEASKCEFEDAVSDVLPGVKGDNIIPFPAPKRTQ